VIRLQDILETDVFCGRQYRGSDHPGNVEYQETIRANKTHYQQLKGSHKKKTAMTRYLLEHVILGRFVGINNGIYYLLTEGRARSKIRQALSEKNH
jgi:hypothetical protein